MAAVGDARKRAAESAGGGERGSGDALYETPGDATYPDVLHEDIPTPVSWWWTPEGRAEHDARLIAEAERRGAERALREVRDRASGADMRLRGMAGDETPHSAHLFSKAEGVRLVMSYIGDSLRVEAGGSA